MNNQPHSIKAFMIAAPKSASGKTTITLGLLTALRRKNIHVRAAKSGPDYIDPAFHAIATQNTSFNLDSWAMPFPLLDHLFNASTKNAELFIIESSMGFLDGIENEEGKRGCGADLAIRYNIPIILVLDITGQAQSAAAIAYGFANINPKFKILGVILNNVASPRHYQNTKAAFDRINIPILGSVPRNSKLHLPTRHLGLIQAEEHEGLDNHLDFLADFIEENIDLDKLLSYIPQLSIPSDNSIIALPPLGQRIAIARDLAFSFIYPHILDGWHRQGASIHFFSPLQDEAPSEKCDSCWLPGGYPELYAEKIANANQFLQGLQNFAQTKTVHGECGGYMVMGKSLIDKNGQAHRMSGLLSHSCSYAKPKIHLGYRIARLPNQNGDLTIYGHEFHYATLSDPGSDQPYALLSDGTDNYLGPEGGRRNKVTGCFFHSIALKS